MARAAPRRRKGMKSFMLYGVRGAWFENFDRADVMKVLLWLWRMLE